MISEVTNEDNMVMMSRYPDKFFDLAIVDPPYGIGASQKFAGDKRKSGNGAACKSAFMQKNWDNDAPPIEYFFELVRVSKHQIIWGANHFISRMPFDSTSWIVWDKNNGTTKFADAELAYTSHKGSVRKFTFTWNGMLQENMKDKEVRIHPTQKPVQLYKWLLQNYAVKGDKILDTHMGSQSSRMAAYDMGFDYYGCELDREYFDAGNKRFELFKQQGVLF